MSIQTYQLQAKPNQNDRSHIFAGYVEIITSKQEKHIFRIFIMQVETP